VIEDRGLHGPGRSRLARYVERHQQRHPDVEARENRRRLLSGLQGRVIEIGCGDGRSFELYPPEVEHLLAVEPDSAARERALRAAADCPIAIEVVDGSGSRLPADDSSFDYAFSCWALCSVPDQAAALAEIRRVLKPGGELRFYEHVRSRNLIFRSLQRLVDRTFWPGMLGGCRTALDTERALVEAGFEIVELGRGFHSSSLLTLPSAPYVLGAARASAGPAGA
jgi:ubiquinone/menaquinone biosynthesis C-methylase UbiE